MVVPLSPAAKPYWRREGSREALLRPFNTLKEPIRKEGADFLVGPVVIRQGLMFLI